MFEMWLSMSENSANWTGRGLYSHGVEAGERKYISLSRTVCARFHRLTGGGQPSSQGVGALRRRLETLMGNAGVWTAGNGHGMDQDLLVELWACGPDCGGVCSTSPVARREKESPDSRRAACMGSFSEPLQRESGRLQEVMCPNLSLALGAEVRPQRLPGLHFGDPEWRRTPTQVTSSYSTACSCVNSWNFGGSRWMWLRPSIAIAIAVPMRKPVLL